MISDVFCILTSSPVPDTRKPWWSVLDCRWPWPLIAIGRALCCCWGWQLLITTNCHYSNQSVSTVSQWKLGLDNRQSHSYIFSHCCVKFSLHWSPYNFATLTHMLKTSIFDKKKTVKHLIKKGEHLLLLYDALLSFCVIYFSLINPQCPWIHQWCGASLWQTWYQSSPVSLNFVKDYQVWKLLFTCQSN